MVWNAVYCGNCGASIDVGSDVCRQCGAPAPRTPVDPGRQAPSVPAAAYDPTPGATGYTTSTRVTTLHVPGPPAAPGGRRTSKRVLAGSLLPTISIVFIVIGMLTTQWYVLSDESTLEWFGVTTDIDTDMDYGLTKSKYNIVTVVDGERDEMEGEMEYEVIDELGDVEYIGYAKTTRMLMFVGIVLIAAFIAFGIVAGLGLLASVGAIGRFLPFVVGLVAFALLLSGLLYFASNFGGQIDEDFDYAYGMMPDSAHVGGSWYFVLVGAILLLVGSLMTIGPKASAGGGTVQRPTTPIV